MTCLINLTPPGPRPAAPGGNVPAAPVSPLFPHGPVVVTGGRAVEAWVQTHSGVAFDLVSPRVEDVRLEDIARALGRVCRFNGHTRFFYSVAQHSLLMAGMLGYEHPYALEALLHDAAEAYVGDMVSPVKALVPEFRALEDRVMEAVCLRFGLRLGEADCAAVIHALDRQLLATEVAALLPTARWPYASLEGVEPARVAINYWHEAFAATRFLDLGEALGRLRGVC